MEAVSTPRPIREAVRVAGTLAVAASLTALILRGFDQVHALVTGEPHGILRVRDIDAAERLLGGRLLVPTFFPQSIRWPPATVRVAGGPPRAVALEFTGRDGRWTRLVICQTLEAGGDFPSGLLAAGREWYSTPVTVAGERTTLESVRVGSEGSFDQVTVHRTGRTILLRYDGPADELVRMAATLRSTRP